MCTHVVSKFILDPNIFSYLGFGFNKGFLIFPIQFLISINIKVLNVSNLLKIKTFIGVTFLLGEVLNMKFVFFHANR